MLPLIAQGIPSYSHLFQTASSTLTKTTYNSHTSLAFQSLSSTQPVDPSYTYNELISQGYLSSDGDGLKGAGGYQRIWDSCTGTPFLWDPTTRIWISYDDGESAALKADYARKMGLAGVGFYDSTGFDVVGLKRIAKGLVGELTVDSTDDEEPEEAASSAADASTEGEDSTVYLGGAASASATSKAHKASITSTRTESSSTTVWWTPESTVWWTASPTSSVVWWTPESATATATSTSTAHATTTTPPSGVWTAPANDVKVPSASKPSYTSSRSSERSSASKSSSTHKSEAASSSAFVRSASRSSSPSPSASVKSHDLAAALVFGSSSAAHAESTATASSRTRDANTVSGTTKSVVASTREPAGQAAVLATASSDAAVASASPLVELVAKRAWSSRPQHRAGRHQQGR